MLQLILLVLSVYIFIFYYQLLSFNVLFSLFSSQIGSTPLHFACGYNATACVALLLDIRAQIDVENKVNIHYVPKLRFCT